MLKWVATFIIIWFIYEVRGVFPPIIVGAIIAYLLLPLVQSLASYAKIPVGVATAVVYAIAAAIMGLTAWWLVPSIVKEITELAANKEQIITGFLTQIANQTHWSGDVKEMTDQVITGLGESIGKPSEIAHSVSTVSHGALAVLVCVVSSIYFTLDSPAVGRFFLRYLPPERREEAIVLTTQMNKLLTKYVQGQLILIVLMASVAFLFLNFVLHMRYALPVAILSGFLEIIPVLGPILAISTAVLVAVWQFGMGSQWIQVIVFYTLARWIEDYIVVPKVIGHAVELHPLAVIFAVLCGEHLAGGLGMLIAIPVAACIKLFIDFFYFGREPEPDHGHHHGHGHQHGHKDKGEKGDKESAQQARADKGAQEAAANRALIGDAISEAKAKNSGPVILSAPDMHEAPATRGTSDEKER
jgi:predicted PurR-regulated permease PerM